MPDDLADLLAAYDDAVAGGITPRADAPPWQHLDAETQARLDGNRHVLDLLEDLWPRTDPFAPTPDQRPPFAFGRFAVKRQLGAGGCGVVFLADDPILGRAVALKVPRPEVLGSPDLRRRFLREAQTAAVLSHPNIVPVYEAGGADGVCYIAAEFCPGPTLAAWHARHPGSVPSVSAAALVAAVADAMGYAHRRGIVHRDLKPSNILLDVPADPTRGPRFVSPGNEAAEEVSGFAKLTLAEYVPRVTDFGFAKLMERSDDGTRNGTLIGTPQYMAPEQADGRLSAVGPATDVYALGVILYELITGRPAHKGANDADTLRQVVTVDPPRPRSIERRIPRDLEAVCLKCLDKNPARRYPDGDALAADLWRFLGNQPTKARPVGPTERVVKWAVRNPVMATLATVAAAALVTLWVGEYIYRGKLANQNIDLRTALDQAEIARRDAAHDRSRAEERTAAARRQAYLAQMRYAGRLAVEGRLTDAAVGQWEPDAGDDDLRGWEWHYLSRLGGAALVRPAHRGPVRDVAVSADGRTAVSVGAGDLCAWDVATGQMMRRIALGSDIVSRGVVSADGRWAAVGIELDGCHRLRAFDLTTGAVGFDATKPPNDWIHPGGFRDGQLIYFSKSELWTVDTAGGNPRRIHDDSPRQVVRAGMAGRGPVVYASVGGPPYRTSMVDPAGGPSLPLPEGASEFAWVTATADGQSVAAGNRNETIVWPAAGGPPVRFPWSHGRSSAGVPLADGSLVILGWGDGDGAGELSVGRWEGGRMSKVKVIDPQCAIATATVTPDGRRYVIGGLDGAVRFRDADPAGDSVSRAAHGPGTGWPAAVGALAGGSVPAVADFAHLFNQPEAWAVAVSPDGKTVVTTGDDHLVRVWDAATVRCRATLGGHTKLVTSVAFRPDGKQFFTAGYDGTVRAWDAATLASLAAFEYGDKVRALAVAPDGRAVAAAGSGGQVVVWDWPTGTKRHTLSGCPNRVRDVVFTADGRSLIVSDGDEHLRWWDAAAGTLRFDVPTPGLCGRLAVTPDRPGDPATVVIGTETGLLSVRDAKTGAELVRASGQPRRLAAVAVSPDGRTVATGGLAGAIRLWHRKTGDELFALTATGPQVYGLAFAPDGSYLAAVRHDGSLLVWDAR